MNMLPDDAICWTICKEITRYELALDQNKISEAQIIGLNLMDRLKLYPELAEILGIANIILLKSSK